MVVLTEMGRAVSLVFLLLFLAAFVNSGNALSYTIAFFCLVLVLISSLYAWLRSRDIECHRDLSGSTVFSGDPLDAPIVITENQDRWRQIQVLDQYTNLITGHTTLRSSTVMTEQANSLIATVSGERQHAERLPDGRRVTRMPDVLRFGRRGHYRLGPITVCSYDPFGLVYVQKVFKQTEEIIVYPHPLQVPDVVLSGAGGRQNIEVRPLGQVGESSDFHGIRPYVQGDDLRRVHWKSTAHTGKLAVKEFEYQASGAVQLVLDLQNGVHLGSDDYSTLEAAITLTASLLNHVIHAGNNAGLLMTGEKVVTFPPESGQRQLHRALEALALARDDGKTPLNQVLLSGEGPRSRRCTTVVISPTTDTGIIGPLLTLRGQSAQVLLVLIDPRSFYEAEQDSLRADRTVWSFATKPLDLKSGIRAITSRQHLPTTEEHAAVRAAAIAAGIEVYSIGPNVPFHQALQGIRSRL